MNQAEEQDREPSMAQWLDRGRGYLILTAIVAAVIIIGQFTPISPVRAFFGRFDWLTEQGVRLAKQLFESYGYPTVFFAPLLENTIFLGALIPGTLVMLLAGLSTHDGLISFWPAVLLGIAGAIIGDTISYGIGRYGWRRLGAKSRLARWAEEMREPLLSHSVWLVLSYHFAGYSRMIGPPAAGFLRMPFLRWMLLDYIGVAIWVFVFLSAGFLLGVFGLSLDDSERNIQVLEIVLFAFFVIAIVSVLRATRGARRRPRANAAETPPSSDGHQQTAASVMQPTDSPTEAEERTR